MHTFDSAGFIDKGRETELTALLRKLNLALHGQPQIALVVGDAGIGKTSIIREVCRRAQKADPELVVGWGECSAQDGRGEPYLPFKQILSALIGDVAATRPQQLLTGDNEARIKRIVEHSVDAIVEIGPDLVGLFIPGAGLLARAAAFTAKKTGRIERLKKIVEQASRDPDLRPEHLYEQYTKVLLHLAESTPIIIVLDDLHWADPGTCSLLFYLSRRMRQVENLRLMVIGACRPAELHRVGSHPLSQLRLDMRRYWDESGGPSIETDLTDTTSDTAGRAFIDSLLDTTPNRLDDDFRRILWERTEGHPLFVIETLNLLEASGVITRNPEGDLVLDQEIKADGLPNKIEAVIGARVHGLSNELRETLECASVEGEVFTAEVVAQVMDVSERDIGRLLDSELTKGHRLILPEVQTDSAKRMGVHKYRFQHSVFQQYLYDSLGPMERAHLHGSVGTALEKLYTSDPVAIRSYCAELARHFSLGPRSSCLEKAVDYFIEAGNWAMAQVSWETAASQYQHARDLLESSGKTADTRWCSLLLALGDAQMRSGHGDLSKATLESATGAARLLDDADMLAQVALYAGGAVGVDEVDSDVILLVEEAEKKLRLLDDKSSQQVRLHVRLLCKLAVALYYVPRSLARRRKLCDEAVKIAESLGDQELLAWCLGARYRALWGPDNLKERLSDAVESVRLADEAADGVTAFWSRAGRFRLLHTLLEVGDLAAVRAEFETAVRAAEESRQPFDEWVVLQLQTMFSLIGGRYREAEELANRSLELGARAYPTQGPLQHHARQMLMIRREQDRLLENGLELVFQDLVDRNPTIPHWKCLLIWMYSEAGRKAEAQSMLAEVAARDFAGIPRDAYFITNIALLAEACSGLNVPPIAADLFKLLEPYHDRNVTPSANAICYGSASYYLGCLAASESQWDVGAQYFERALILNETIDAPPFLGHTQFRYAEMLAKQGSDRSQVHRRIDEAASIATNLEMPYLLRKVALLKSSY